MKRSLRSVALAAGFAAALVTTLHGGAAAIPPAARPEEVGLASDRLPRIHETVQRYLDDRRLAGAVSLAPQCIHGSSCP